MKLLNQSLTYLSASIFVIVTIWAGIFYFIMLDEIKGSIDEGLENQKRLIIRNAAKDESILTKEYFDESFFTVKEIGKAEALKATDQYIDKILDMQDADDLVAEPEPVRMLITTFESKGSYYQLIVSNSMLEEQDLITALLLNVLALYLLLISSIIIINNVTLKKIWKPFYDFLALLKTYQIGSTQSIPKVKTNSTEFNDMQKAVNTMIEYSLVLFDKQKQFIENASHELQTPLAIATNKLELVLENGNLKEAEAEKIVEAFQIVQRLIRLNKSLLLLSKIENKQFFDNKEISINKIVLQNVKELDELIDFKNIKIITSFNNDLTVELDETLANIIISNLLRNAIFHNIENGSIEINISHHSIKIINTGHTNPLNNDTIFNRFHKNKEKSNGSGLGLAITKAIVDLYAFSISYQFENNKHSFEINFSAQS